jgi:hypothetical protein
MSDSYTVVEPKYCELCGASFMRDSGTGIKWCWPCVASGGLDPLRAQMIPKRDAKLTVAHTSYKRVQ